MSNRRRSGLIQRRHKSMRPGCPRCRSDLVKRMGRDGLPDWMACGDCGAGWPAHDDAAPRVDADRDEETP